MSNTDSSKNYIENMLLNIADELNVKEVVIEKENVYATYYYDTINGTSVGFNGDEWTMGALVLSGDILEDMEYIRGVIKSGLRQRLEAGIKVRQPLQRITLQARF